MLNSLKKNKIYQKIEDIFYKKFIKTILLTSRLGRQSVLGHADTGLNFEHMYDNKAEGITAFGKMVDRILLDLPSVKATRNRKDNIAKILRNEIRNNLFRKRKTKVLDVGSGTSRYLIELKNEYSGDHIEALCLDYDKETVSLARRLAGGMPRSRSYVRYTRANAMKIKHLRNLARKIKWTPNVVIASGFIYYLEDESVKQLLKEVYQGLESKGMLIMSNVQKSLSQKLMEKVCTTQYGQSWAVHYRNPEHLREWLLETGFADVVIGSDPLGMYNICTARK